MSQIKSANFTLSVSKTENMNETFLYSWVPLGLMRWCLVADASIKRKKSLKTATKFFPHSTTSWKFYEKLSCSNCSRQHFVFGLKRRSKLEIISHFANTPKMTNYRFSLRTPKARMEWVMKLLSDNLASKWEVRGTRHCDITFRLSRSQIIKNYQNWFHLISNSIA